jgi:hypothetical protein
MTELWPKINDAVKRGFVLELDIVRQKRSNDQNEMFHAIIGQIAKQAEHLGAKWTGEDWKRLLVHSWAHETGRIGRERIVPGLRHEGIVQLGLQTRKFTKEDAMEFTEWLLAWCAENGVTLNEIH